METTGQRLTSAAVDLAFFFVIAYLGHERVLQEPVLATLLSAYAGSRFGVAMMKARNLSGGPDSGTSGKMQATPQPPHREAARDISRRVPPTDPRTFQDGAEPAAVIVPAE